MPSRECLAAAGVVAALALGGCGTASQPTTAARSTSPTTTPQSTQPPSTTSARSPASKPPRPAHPRLLPVAVGTQPTPGFVPAVRWNGQTAAWIARTPSGIALLSFDQRLLRLHLHFGAAGGWRFGPEVNRSELGRLVAGFNGGFKLNLADGGFVSYGRTGAPLRNGLGSVVTYADGSTDIGSWHQELPTPGKQVVSVRQNLPLLIDRGRSASNTGCLSCWGATLGGVSDPARAGLGITADGRLIWAGGEHLTVAGLANALLAAHVVRAVELDINPEWVAAYLYGHHGVHSPPAPEQVMPGQQGIPGQFLAPWSRDFFTIVTR